MTIALELPPGLEPQLVLSAIDESVPAPVLSAALYDRFSSRSEADFGGRVLSARCCQFGGHQEKAVE